MSENKLKPCPFCGSGKIFIDFLTQDSDELKTVVASAYCKCSDCGGRGHRKETFMSPGKFDYAEAKQKACAIAAEQWNARGL